MPLGRSLPSRSRAIVQLPPISGLGLELVDFEGAQIDWPPVVVSQVDPVGQVVLVSQSWVQKAGVAPQFAQSPVRHSVGPWQALP